MAAYMRAVTDNVVEAQAVSDVRHISLVSHSRLTEFIGVGFPTAVPAVVVTYTITCRGSAVPSSALSMPESAVAFPTGCDILCVDCPAWPCTRSSSIRNWCQGLLATLAVQSGAVMAC